jgi:hypothetical protein
MLSDYAKSHMRLVEIDRRFETVIQRHPKKDTERMVWRIDAARREGIYQRSAFASDVMMFNIYFRR